MRNIYHICRKFDFGLACLAKDNFVKFPDIGHQEKATAVLYCESQFDVEHGQASCVPIGMMFLAVAFDERVAGRRFTRIVMDDVVHSGIALKQVCAQHGAMRISEHTNVSKVRVLTYDNTHCVISGVIT
jgi:hypothetical protein